MGYFDSRDDPRARPVTPEVIEPLPARCPTCRSTSIATTAKNPNADSYWRCTSCGEVWNNGRRNSRRPSSNWR